LPGFRRFPFLAVVDDLMIVLVAAKKAMHPGIEILHLDLLHGGRTAEGFQIFLNVGGQIAREGGEENLLLGRGPILGKPFRPMHRQNGLAGPCAAQYPHRTATIPLRQLALGRMQENPPLRERRVQHGGHRLLIRDHHEARLRFCRLDGRGEVFRIDWAIDTGFP
jgi:hypothetical protein